MLPNELVDKIFKYRYRNFKIFLSKIRKVNREYKRKYYTSYKPHKYNCQFCIILKLKGDRTFLYNCRNITKQNYANFAPRYMDIFNPFSGKVTRLSKNYI